MDTLLVLSEWHEALCIIREVCFSPVHDSVREEGEAMGNGPSYFHSLNPFMET